MFKKLLYLWRVAVTYRRVRRGDPAPFRDRDFRFIFTVAATAAEIPTHPRSEAVYRAALQECTARGFDISAITWAPEQ